MGAAMSAENGAGTPTGAGATGAGGYEGRGSGWAPPTPPPGAHSIPPSASMPPPMPPYPPPTPYYGYPPVPPRRRHPVRTGAAVLALVAASVAAGIGIGHEVWRPSAPAASAGGLTPSAPNNGQTAPQFGGGSGGFGGSGGTGGSSGSGGTSGGTGSGGASATGVAAKVDPELVNISTNLGYQDIQAAGTGIVLTANGEVLTNNHVIAGATTITATDIGNGRSYTATVVGYDRTGDMAVLQLKDASGLATVSLGDSSKAAVGDAVTGIGNAGGTGLTPTAASGSVTGINQSVTASDEVTGSAEQLTGMIQVNADIQPGDSGGPLVNASGQVIGMDTAGSQSSGVQQQSTTQGFAIPINTALPIVQQIEAGTASSTVHVGPTAFLGVEVSTAAGSSAGSGALVSGVIPNSPAAQAGLAQGDLITSVGGKSVSSADTLTTLMAGHSPGDKVAVSWTDSSGASHTLTLDLASGPAN